MAACARSPWPVDPDDVPDDAVRYVRRTMLRYCDRDPLDDDLARVIVAGVIAILTEPDADAETVELGAAVVSELTAGTGLMVTIQASAG